MEGRHHAAEGHKQTMLRSRTGFVMQTKTNTQTCFSIRCP